MYPNLYTLLVGNPGVGKSRVINEAAKLIAKLPDPFIAPTSINSASIIDHLVECKRIIVNMPGPALEYHTMAIFVGEFGTFMSEFKDDLIAQLTDFYNVSALGYGQRRRGGQLKIQIDRPQLNMLVGSTPSNLMKFMPEGAWEQGFTSRILFICSNDDQTLIDDFAPVENHDATNLLHDLQIINALIGQFTVTDEYAKAIRDWRELGEPPRPTHPRLAHYNSRRKEHLYRLSMISAVDRGNALLLAKDDFNRAMGWLLEAEENMAQIFNTTSVDSDALAMDEIYHFIVKHASTGPVEEFKIVKFAKDKVKASVIMPTLGVMEKAGMIRIVAVNRAGMRSYAIGEGLGNDLQSQGPGRHNPRPEIVKTVAKISNPG